MCLYVYIIKCIYIKQVYILLAYVMSLKSYWSLMLFQNILKLKRFEVLQRIWDFEMFKTAKRVFKSYHKFLKNNFTVLIIRGCFRIDEFYFSGLW